jgi:DNA polymerase-1
LKNLMRRVVKAGAAFRWNGADLEVIGSARLDETTRRALMGCWPAMYDRLLDVGSSQKLSDLVAALGVEVQEVHDAARAREIVSSLPDSVGLDVETCVPGSQPPPLAIAVTHGRPSKTQPKPQDERGLDPYSAEIRLIQVCDPDRQIAYVFDLFDVPWSALAELWSRQLVIHNATFELMFLFRRGIEPQRLICTQQLAGLAIGTRWGRRSLAGVAEHYLGIELDKSLQTSHWAAPNLSDEQVLYAAIDAVIPLVVRRRMEEDAGQLALRAFEIQNAAVPVAARMRLRGVPFDSDVHRETVRGWAAGHAAARARFADLTGEDVPPRGAGRARWLEERLPEEAVAKWPRTATGQLSTRREFMEEIAAAYPEVRPLLEIEHLEKRLSSLGDGLVEAVHPVTGRIHANLMVAGADTGRCTCSGPNLQQLPPDARRAVIAPDGRVLVVADYSMMELRAVAELAEDEAMRQAFRDRQDLHKLTAARIAGVDLEAVTPQRRSAAKPVNFGSIFGQRARGLAAYAWSAYRVDMTQADAQAALGAFFEAYPAINPWQQRTYHLAQETGVLRTWSGRPIRGAWHPRGELWWNKTCNHPVQGSCADAALIAMARIEHALAGVDAELIMMVHDEFVVEAAEERAEAVAAIVEEQMTRAFTEVFPEAPTTGLVDVAIVGCWAEAKA